MKKKINLYVDDLRDCPEGYTVARTMEEALEILLTTPVGILTLDHDLGQDANLQLLPTGYDLVKKMCENGEKLQIDKIHIHTDNGVGRENMYKTLVRAQERGFIDQTIQIYHYPITRNIYTEKS